jgi:endonuclease G, mitochondrial
MTHEERVSRLKSMLSQVAGPDGLESLAATPPAGGYESLGESAAGARLEVSSTLRKLATGQPLSPAEAFGLEAIVLPDKRPVVFIRGNKFDPVPMDEWAHLNKPEIHDRLEPLFASIGRVELPTTPSIPYGGTAFVVGHNLLMTNRHVARLFAEGVGTQLTYHTGGAEVDFKQEQGSTAATFVGVIGVRMIHPYWDMALMEVEGLPADAVPLKLSVKYPEEFLDRDVVVVGYPARDYRNPYDVQDRVFKSTYGVKRMQPGKARRRDRIRSFENDVDAMTHDSSTLGGNSGSAVLQVETGHVVGLHFAGEYLKANYAVPTYELARDSRVVDAGLNFQGTVPPTTAWAGSWGGPESPRSVGISTVATTATATFNIPIQVTVVIGSPAAAVAVPATSPTVPAVPAAPNEKVPVIFPDLGSRRGYRRDYLEFGDGTEVPLPELTEAGIAAAAKTDDGEPVLRYHKFSLVVHKARRLALFTAANVDWRPAMRKIGTKKPTRKQLNGFTGNEKEDWVTDPRIPFDHQLPDYFYVKDSGAFDRGHLVRRDDVAWGESFEDMQMGNGDTFHTTNCSPQTAEFNRSDHEANWGALEDMVQKQTGSEKVCVFSGPVLDDADGYFHGLVKSGAKVSVQIPNRFWKILVANDGGAPAAFGFVLDQDLSAVELHTELVVPDGWKQYMKPIAEIEGLLRGLAKLGPLKDWDKYEG